MSSVNKVFLVGRLGKDPELRYTKDGAAIANISIATSSKYKNKAGEMVEETEWHRVTFFGRLAEIAEEYLKKGSQICVEGRIKTSKYTDKDGVEKYATGIIASEMQMLGGRDQNAVQSPGTDPLTSNPAVLGGGPGYTPSPAARAQEAKTNPSFVDMDDDIPF